jgi:ribosomal protein S18 acetylase RimI-like enzyme
MSHSVRLDSITIRPALPSDAEVAALLLYSAYTHSQLVYPPQIVRDGETIERLRRSFRLEGTRFSYENTQIADSYAGAIGAILNFGGKDEVFLNTAVGNWLEREARDDEWYVDAVAVLEGWGHMGIGTRLMQVAEQHARERHYPKIALHVALENKQAISLYVRLGYVPVEHVLLYQHPHLRMVKALKD